MKDLKDMTAAELVAEFEKINYRLKMVGLFCSQDTIQHYKLKMSAITAELDARCKKEGLSVIKNQLAISNPQCYEFEYVGIDDNSSEHILAEVIIEDAAEFHALLGYLLSKEVNNG